ncbi:translation initiation factor IF-1A [Candidatus Pacearchaeota archaeon CG_4_9_14_0_2_um_filter_39_13]|nr:translation initiation factor IF-1A [Candidatus Pacearchaeota archaeon]OIO43139.1 MAG: hypothetical protein AUJ64_03080 [Candidatus Pacearchaeota archaeon CG1_02_39_14]PJC44707.1 MAG: translation initiation factor IF-1A [Candidatus Pacearchaeota archaeon CG_4_9_14_0_2_um_filter_39_13]
MNDDFGDFEEIKDQEIEEEEQKTPSRIRMPQGKELIGIVRDRLGGNRMHVQTTDGKTRNCRVPGRYKRRLWLRPGDIVIIIPWIDDDAKGDIIYKYPPVAVTQIKKTGLISSIRDEF